MCFRLNADRGYSPSWAGPVRNSGPGTKRGKGAARRALARKQFENTAAGTSSCSRTEWTRFFQLCTQNGPVRAGSWRLRRTHAPCRLAPGRRMRLRRWAAAWDVCRPGECDRPHAVTGEYIPGKAIPEFVCAGPSCRKFRRQRFWIPFPASRKKKNSCRPACRVDSRVPWPSKRPQKQADSERARVSQMFTPFVQFIKSEWERE